MEFLIMLLQEVLAVSLFAGKFRQGEDEIDNVLRPALGFPRRNNTKSSNEWQFLRSAQPTLPESWQKEPCRGPMAQEFPNFHSNFIAFLKTLAADIASADL